MKFLIYILFITVSSASYAGSKCMLSAKDLTFTTPKATNITSTFWQDDKEDGEIVKRLYVTYKNGSIAIIKHKFCSTYKFEAAYYAEDKDKVTSTEKIKNSLTLFLSYVAHKDNTQKKAIKHMITELDKYTFVQDEVTGASYNGHDSAYGDTGYSITYFPINYSSLHSAAIFVEVGIGGIH